VKITPSSPIIPAESQLPSRPSLTSSFAHCFSHLSCVYLSPVLRRFSCTYFNCFSHKILVHWIKLKQCASSNAIRHGPVLSHLRRGVAGTVILMGCSRMSIHWFWLVDRSFSLLHLCQSLLRRSQLHLCVSRFFLLQSRSDLHDDQFMNG
jgi:hypothetical protein